MYLHPVRSVTEQVADHLESKIITGRIPARARIQEVRLARELGVSRGSVREALLILARGHLIDVAPRRGATVSAFGAAEIVDCSDLYEELQIRYFGALASSGRDPSPLFRPALDAMDAAAHARDGEGMLEARRAFIRAGLEQAGNRYLVSSVASLMPSGLRLAHLASAHPRCDARDCSRYHGTLVRAMAAGEQTHLQELVRAFTRRERELALCVARGEA
jgi:DNA-binding GntR family transcriptional regulator